MWCNTTDTNVRKLQSVQNFAAHIVSNTKQYDHVISVLKNLNENQFILQRCHFGIYKCMMGVASEYLGNKMHFLDVR